MQGRMRGWVEAALLALLATSPAGALVIDNGLAPPNPDNVITDASLPPNDFDVVVRDQGCAGEPTPCPSPGPPTTVEVQAQLVTLTTLDSSSAIVTSGWVEDIVAENDSRVEMDGGIANRIFGRHQTTILMTSGSTIEDGLGVDLFEDAALFITGGVADSVHLRGSSSAEMTGGVVPAFFLVEGSSSATFSAGRIGTGSDLSSIVSQDAAVFTLSGGLVFASLSATDGGVIRIVGSDFFVDGAPVGLGPIQATSGILTGTLLSGDSLNQLFSVSGGGTIVLVPEPSTALLVACGLWALAVRRRSRPRARPFGRPLGSAGVAGSV